MFGADVKVINDQVDPLQPVEGEELCSLKNAMKSFILYYNCFKTNIIYNNKEIQGERFVQTLLKMVSDPDGLKYLDYLQEREAYTVNIASYQLSIDTSKLYPYTKAFVNMGVLVKVGKLGKGLRGFPTYIYALRDAPQVRIDEAAQLYKDVTSSHVSSLDEYLVDYDLQRVAEEAVNHLDDEGSVGTWRLIKLLSAVKKYDEDNLIQVKRIIRGMGYTVVEGA